MKTTLPPNPRISTEIKQETSVEAYLNGHENAEFNRKCNEALDDYYIHKTQKPMPEYRKLIYFNDAYKVAIRCQEDRSGEPPMGNIRNRDGKDHYRVTSVITLEKECDSPHFSMPIAYQLLQRLDPPLPPHIAVPNNEEIEKGFKERDNEFFKLLDRVLNPDKTRERLRNILNELLAEKDDSGKLFFNTKSLWAFTKNPLLAEGLIPRDMTDKDYVNHVDSLDLTYRNERQRISINCMKDRSSQRERTHSKEERVKMLLKEIIKRHQN